MKTLAALLFLALSGPALCESAPCPLHGTCKSDATRTLADIAANDAMSRTSMNAISNDFFGHMIHEWTCTELTAKFDYQPHYQPMAYRIAEHTSEFLLVTFPGDEEGDLRLVWEGDCYKIRFGNNRYHEYFCPVAPP